MAVNEAEIKSFLETHKYLILLGAVVGGYIYYRAKNQVTSGADLAAAYAQGAQAAGSQAATSAAPSSDPTAQYFNDLLAYQQGQLGLFEQQTNYLTGIGSTPNSGSAGNSGSNTGVVTTPPAATSSGSPMASTPVPKPATRTPELRTARPVTVSTATTQQKPTIAGNRMRVI